MPYQQRLQKELEPRSDQARRDYIQSSAKELSDRTGIQEPIAELLKKLTHGSWRGHLGSERDPTSSNPLKRYGGHATGAIVQGLLFALIGRMLGRGVGNLTGKEGPGPADVGTALGALFGAGPNIMDAFKTKDLVRPYVDSMGNVVPTEDVTTRKWDSRKVRKGTGQRVFRDTLVDPETKEPASIWGHSIGEDSELDKYIPLMRTQMQDYFKGVGE